MTSDFEDKQKDTFGKNSESHKVIYLKPKLCPKLSFCVSLKAFWRYQKDNKKITREITLEITFALNR